jgi:predicted metal-dependent peptidase
MTTPDFAIVEPTAQQLKMWGDTRAALIWHCPAFTHIFYEMMHKNNSEHIALFTNDAEKIPVAATDGSNIIINVDTFFTNYSLNERLFIIAHEIAHGIFGHCELGHKIRMMGAVKYPDGVELPYDHMTMNHAMDYVINDMLYDSKIGIMPKDALHDTVKGKHDDDVLTVYRRIYNPKGNNTNGQKSFDQHLQPGTTTGNDPTQAANARNAQEWKTAVAGAIASARAQGKLPASMDRALSGIVEPTVDWTDKIIGFFARKPGGGSYNWRSPDRRFITRDIIAPSRSGFGAGPVVVAVDTSGSIGQPVLDMFFGEMYGILDDVRPTQIILMFCDAQVHRIDYIEDTSDLLDIKKKGAPGGGGTAFEPVFHKIAELDIQPDALIYLTDGYGSFNVPAPSYSVLWGSISTGVKYPFGEVVELPKM